MNEATPETPKLRIPPRVLKSFSLRSGPGLNLSPLWNRMPQKMFRTLASALWHMARLGLLFWRAQAGTFLLQPKNRRTLANSTLPGDSPTVFLMRLHCSDNMEDLIPELPVRWGLDVEPSATSGGRMVIVKKAAASVTVPPHKKNLRSNSSE